MGNMSCLKKNWRIHRKGLTVSGVCFFLAVFLFTVQAGAFTLGPLERPITINGYINQGVSFGVTGDHYDTKAGFQQAMLQALLEVEYYPVDDLKLFATGYLNKDWAYEILDDDDEWKFRQFDKSKSELSLYSDYEDYLKECHVTWTPENFNIRIGKQIDSWGRMTGVRIMDKINPIDGRRGFSDVEFETIIIPIWLVKAEYFPETTPGWLEDLGFELLFNPNADFIPSKKFSTGNDVHGIWAADQVQEVAPGVAFRIGSLNLDLEEPGSWNSDGFEYGFKIQGMVERALFTLNYFDGVDNFPVMRSALGAEISDIRDDKGNRIMHPNMEGYYADQKFLGLTFSRDFENLYAESLGGVAPVLRCEALYEMDTTLVTDGKAVNPATDKEDFEEYDAIHWGMAIEWKFRAKWLNPTTLFTIEPSFSNYYVLDYPSDYSLRSSEGAMIRENTYDIIVMLYTYYLHDKLLPRIYYQRTLRGNEKSDRWLFSLGYTIDENWSVSTALYLLEEEGYKAIDNKDNISFTVKYQF